MGCLKMFYACYRTSSLTASGHVSGLPSSGLRLSLLGSTQPRGRPLQFMEVASTSGRVLRRLRDSSQFRLPVAPTSTQLLRSTECHDAQALPASTILLVKSLFQVCPPLSVTSPLRLISWRRKIGAQCYCCSSTIPMSGWLRVEDGRRGVVPSHVGGAFLSAT